MVLDVSEVQTGALAGARRYDGPEVEVEGVRGVREPQGGGELRPRQYDGQHEGLQDGVLQPGGAVGLVVGVEVVEGRVSGEQQSDGVEEEEEPRGEPGYCRGEVRPLLLAGRGNLQPPARPPVHPGPGESRYSLRCSL